MERHWISNVGISNGSREEFNGKFTAKIDFPTKYYTIADADIGGLKSLHTLFDISIWTTCR